MSVVDRFEPREIRDRDDIGSNPTDHPTIGEIIETRYSRRALLGGIAGGTAGLIAATAGLGEAKAASPATESFLNRGVPVAEVGTLSFKEIKHGLDATHHLSTGYKAQVLLRWGDKILADSPDFMPEAQTAAAQAMQFGYNNDFIGYLPYKFDNPNSQHGLLCVNHEYTNPELMFPYMTIKTAFDRIKAEQVAIEMAGDRAQHRRDREGPGAMGPGARRQAQSPHHRDDADRDFRPRGRLAAPCHLGRSDATLVYGTLGNCGGGVTPWGTVLTCEENFTFYFGGNVAGRPRRPRSSATASRSARSRPGSSSTAGSTSDASRTSPTVSAGWSRSTPTIRNRRR